MAKMLLIVDPQIDFINGSLPVPLAAEAMNITAHRIKDLGLIDNVVKEPLGGAHRNYDEMAENLKQRIETDLAELSGVSSDRIVEQRYSRLMKYGYC